MITNTPTKQLDGQELDYWIYRHAAVTADTPHSTEQFSEGYQKGLYRFSEDKSLLPDLLELYSINLQQLAGEWLASASDASTYGDTPLQAVLRLVILQNFGNERAV